MSQVRVRFAPSPTGYLHIGGARTCLFNWLFARRSGGKLILRIEDTDFQRLKDDSIDQIISSLNWLGLEWDEGPGKEGDCGPYLQSQRLELYRNEAERLVEENKAYYCYCTPEELDQRRKKSGQPAGYDGRCRTLCSEEAEVFLKEGRKPVIRIISPKEGKTVIDDIVRGTVAFDNTILDDIIIMKSNGTPTYNFACVIDDNAMKISHVIRAEEHLSNTPKQAVIYQALGYQLPEFAHVPMILAPDRSKLSKRHGATSVEEFRELGFLPEAIVNYLCLLGWSEENQNEIFDLSTASRQFSLERVSKNAAVYDTKKLTWINGHYLKTLGLDYITNLSIPFFEAEGIDIHQLGTEKMKAVIALVREKVWTLAELVEGSRYFFSEIFNYDPKGVEKYFSMEGLSKLLGEIIEQLNQLTSFHHEAIELVYREYADRTGIKAAQIIHPTRLALTGRTVSPGLFEVMEILGKEECIRRIRKAVEFIGSKKSGV